jgi:hypothetical protein
MEIAWIETGKFAAKFADAGNWFNFSQLTSFSLGQPKADCREPHCYNFHSE